MSPITLIIIALCAVLLIAAFAIYRRSLSILKLEKNALLDRIVSQVASASRSTKDRTAKAGPIERRLASAGIDSTPAEFCSKAAVIFVGVSLVAMFVLSTAGLPGPLGIPLAALATFIGAWVVLKTSAANRGRKFDEQLISALPTMAQMLRGGRTFEEALRGVADTAGPPLSEEFRIAARELTYNADPGAALRSLGDRTGSEDMMLLSTAVAINAEKGGNLADTIESVSNTIRERASLKRMVKTESATAKASVVAIICIEVFIYLMCFIGNDFFSDFYLGTGIGIAIFIGILAVQVIGILIMVRMTKIQID